MVAAFAQKQAAFLEFDFAGMRAEVEAVAAAAATFQSPVVFSHNDLLAGMPAGCIRGDRQRLTRHLAIMQGTSWCRFP